MDNLKERFDAISPYLTEKTRRLYAAAECIGGGYGKKGEVSQATGVSYRELRRGLSELQEKPPETPEDAGRVRKKGGGRKQLKEKSPEVIKALQELAEPSTLGDPCTPLLYTSKSLRHLAEELTESGHKISHTMVGELLKDMGYTLQANSKTLAGSNHPDRNAQFEHINNKVLEFQGKNQPVISVDCKKHELIGNYKNNGREYHPKGTPIEVKDHDFMDKELGKAIPCGIYDLSENEGFVNVGNDHDTSVFAVESIRIWWNRMGKERYENADFDIYFETADYTREDFAEIAAHTRHYLTHYNINEKEKALSDEDLHVAYEILQYVLIYYFLSELGFSRKYIHEKVGEKQKRLCISLELKKQDCVK